MLTITMLLILLLMCQILIISLIFSIKSLFIYFLILNIINNLIGTYLYLF